MPRNREPDPDPTTAIWALQANVKMLQIEVTSLRTALVTLCVWMSGSAASPLRHDELQRLVHMAEGTDAE